VVVNDVLAKTPGVTAVKVDRKAKDQVTFEAKDEKTAQEALNAFVKSGLCCTVTVGTNKLTAAPVTVEAKGDELIVKGVHICCGACTKAVKALFKDANVTVNGTGAQRDVVITGKGLNGQTVL